MINTVICKMLCHGEKVADVYGVNSRNEKFRWTLAVNTANNVCREAYGPPCWEGAEPGVYPVALTRQEKRECRRAAIDEPVPEITVLS